MQLLERLHGGVRSHDAGEHGTRGVLLDRGWRYDVEVWFVDTVLLGGRIRQLRRLILDRSGIGPGIAMLDVGCGTGNLALAAARRLRGDGQVVGLDPATRQLARARSKARRARLDVEFRAGAVERLPFGDATFDVVTSSLMMHHLPPESRTTGLDEIYRVLRPNGRLVVADFDPPGGPAHEGAAEAPQLMEVAGFRDLRTEHLELPRRHRGWTGITLATGRKAAEAVI